MFFYSDLLLDEVQPNSLDGVFFNVLGVLEFSRDHLPFAFGQFSWETKETEKNSQIYKSFHFIFSNIKKPATMNDEFKIIDKGYGKSWVKMLHIKREGRKHTIREYEVDTRLTLSTERDYTHVRHAPKFNILVRKTNLTCLGRQLWHHRHG